MALAIALVLIAVVAVLFQFVSPWWLTPLASNWKLMDDTLLITLVITGVVFVAINLFIAYAIVRFRHRPGHRAAFEPHNRRLEWWLTGITTAGIVAMLAPGLWVYADLIAAPKDALVFEVVGQQWQWRYRFPGKDGQFGTSDVRFVSAGNPFGINPNDPKGQDDVLVAAPEVHIPVGQPVKVLQRSLDVLHNFYVPQFRVKMDLVPGLVTQFWFTPTRTGRFEVMCAEFCGTAHFNMRGHIVVEEPERFQAWLAAQPTFAQLAKGAAAGDVGAARGRAIAQSRGCLACHSLDGTPGVGPTWKGLFGATRTLVGGAQVKADAEYLRRAIAEPGAEIVQGFAAVMPPAELTAQDVDAVIAFIKEIADTAPAKP